MPSDGDPAPDRPIRGRWRVLDVLLGERAGGAGRDAGEKAARRAEYEALNRKLSEIGIGKYAYFLNYGYVPNENPTFCAVETPAQQLDANSRRLVLEVIGDTAIDGRDVLDVSCGRGALASVLKQHFRPRSYCGVDLSPQAVAFCRAQHAAPGYRFLEGDAEELPCDDACVDVVANIEASHNYPRVEAFFREVRRVLRPGGAFLYTDFLTPALFERNRGALAALGFATERDLDITSNVLLSSDELGAMRLKVYRDPAVRAYMADFLAVPGSEMYRALAAGLLQYRLCRLRRGP